MTARSSAPPRRSAHSAPARMPQDAPALSAAWLQYLANCSPRQLIALVYSPPFDGSAASGRNLMAFMYSCPALNTRVLEEIVFSSADDARQVLRRLSGFLPPFSYEGMPSSLPEGSSLALAGFVRRNIDRVLESPQGEALFAMCVSRGLIQFTPLIDEAVRRCASEGRIEPLADLLLIPSIPPLVLDAVAAAVDEAEVDGDRTFTHLCRMRLGLHSGRSQMYLFGESPAPIASSDAMSTALGVAMRPSLNFTPEGRALIAAELDSRFSQFVSVSAFDNLGIVWLDNIAPANLPGFFALLSDHDQWPSGFHMPEVSLCHFLENVPDAKLLALSPSDLLPLLSHASSNVRASALPLTSRRHRLSAAAPSRRRSQKAG